MVKLSLGLSFLVEQQEKEIHAMRADLHAVKARQDELDEQAHVEKQRVNHLQRLQMETGRTLEDLKRKVSQLLDAQVQEPHNKLRRSTDSSSSTCHGSECDLRMTPR